MILGQTPIVCDLVGDGLNSSSSSSSIPIFLHVVYSTSASDIAKLLKCR